jgi:hypothetical protein
MSSSTAIHDSAAKNRSKASTSRSRTPASSSKRTNSLATIASP